MNHGIHGTHGRRGWWGSWVFWLGVPGLVFLLWVWWIFPTHSLFISAGRRTLDVRSFPEALELVMVDTAYRAPEWSVEVFPIGNEDRVDRENPLLRWSRKYFPGMKEPLHYVSMRAWLPSVLYIVGWFGGVAGWCFWKGRQAKQGATAIGSSGR